MLTWQIGFAFQIVNRLRKGLDVKDKIQYESKSYRLCFVASEVIDFMIQNELASTREEAVELGQYLQTEKKLWHPATGSIHELFDDGYMLFRFASDEEKLKAELKVKSQQRKASLSKIALRLQEDLEIKDRKYRFKTYKSCFVACEAVDFMVQNGMADTREGAVAIGCRLQNDLNFWDHVCCDHTFKDEYLFFRFKSDGDDENDEEQEEGSLKKTLKSFPLSKIAAQLEAGVDVKHRRFRLKTYKSCFIASDAVEYMMQRKMVGSREEAVVLGRLLADKTNLWNHVCHEHEFKDEYLFFRFTLDDTSSKNIDDDTSIASFRTFDSSAQHSTISSRLNLSSQRLNIGSENDVVFSRKLSSSSSRSTRLGSRKAIVA